MNQTEKGMKSMEKRLKIVWILGILFIFLLGCAGADKETSKDPRIRCPKCAGYYDSEQGSAFFDWMQGPGATRK
jgi:hypothetical protein